MRSTWTPCYAPCGAPVAEEDCPGQRLHVRIVKVQGEFTWHRHADTDEFFLVLDGQLIIQLRDRDVVLGPRDLFVVPRGVEHCPRADAEAAVLLLEPGSVINTGDAGGELTAEVEELA
jgi:mannose-6-phosphate isomerase-like protein (cupin superfamily)